MEVRENWRMLLGGVVLLVTFAAVAAFSWANEKAPARLSANLDAFPQTCGDWQGLADRDISADVLQVLGLDEWLLRSYGNARDESVMLYIGYLGGWDPKNRRQTVHSPQFCYGGGGWEIVEKDVREVDVAGRSVPLTWMLVEKDGHRQLVSYWFQWGDRIEAEQDVWDYGTKIA